MIAENQLWLSCVRVEKVALIERLRDPMAFALASKTGVARGKARMLLGDVAHCQLMIVKDLISETEAAGRNPEREPLPRKLAAAWPPPWVEEIAEDAVRDEYEAFREGLCDLVPLLRYEQRACSRRKRAVRAFMAIKLANSMIERHRHCLPARAGVQSRYTGAGRRKLMG